ncbi:transcription repressor OFP1 [Cynara cardunculus var. scolymus]|uniref:Transcription repressor n=1 Tax=Cynara cardunculus var. scolymus TaxID=59895 RepID=A0A118JVQ3_CYNCS|nr:transcription repressor OFP1 [Cynara cardunculus var. scolymus]KVH94134.1 DNA-binding domain, ovate family-like protein [Cynara cardunculus var. scolymus]
MGNYRFRLSDMIPNAWFYKLRDMSKTKTSTNHNKKPPPSSAYHSSSTTTAPPHHHHFSHPRTSFYYTPKVNQFHNSPTSKLPHFPHDPPRKSSKRSRPHRKTIYRPSPKHTTSLAESTQTLRDFFHSPTTNTSLGSPPDPNSQSPSSESTQSGLATASWCTSCRVSSSTSDIIIDINDKSLAKKIDNSSGFDLSPEMELKLPPIITKPAKSTPRNRQTSLSGKKVKETNQTPARKSVTGVKLRPNSPKLAVSKRIVQKSAQKKTLSESFAIVKSSFDPQKDFMVSMMEMIVENNIRASKDLEDLLACYLALNSDEYHDVIVKAFEQIWFALPDL